MKYDLGTSLGAFGTGCAEAATGNGIVGDTCTAQPFDVVAEAKRQTLHHLLINIVQKSGRLTAEEAAKLVTDGYAALEESAQQQAEKSHAQFEAHQRFANQSEELTAALLTISNIQNALNLPGKKGISEEVIELVQKLQTSGTTYPQSVTDGPTTDMDFSRALQWVNAGFVVTRDAWSADAALRRLNAKGKAGKDELVTFYLRHKVPELTVYAAMGSDLLATDWRVLNEPRVTPSIDHGPKTHDSITLTATEWPHRTVAIVFDHPTVGDNRFVPLVREAYRELTKAEERERGDEANPFVASNGVRINVFNLTK